MTMGCRYQTAVLILTVTVFSLAGGLDAWGQSTDMSTEGHFRIDRPVDLSKDKAAALYGQVSDTMRRGYALSKEPTAKQYLKWHRFNTAPYRSAVHGNRYVNNYGNALASRYGKLKTGGKMPRGAILVKDSFTVTADKKALPGALFIMEKLALGTAPEYGDWRYVMILPDGSYYGDSREQTAEKVDFCNGCHQFNEDQDRMFFVPEGYRR